MKPQMVIDARIVGPEMNGISRYIRLMIQGLARIRDNGGGLPYDPTILVRMGSGRNRRLRFPVFPRTRFARHFWIPPSSGKCRPRFGPYAGPMDMRSRRCTTAPVFARCFQVPFHGS